MVDHTYFALVNICGSGLTLIFGVGVGVMDRVMGMLKVQTTQNSGV